MNTSLLKGNTEIDYFITQKELAVKLQIGRVKMVRLVKEILPDHKRYARLTPKEASKILKHLINE